MYLICPDYVIGNKFRMTINGETYLEFTANSTLLNWTLDDLNINSNDDYEINFWDSEDNDVAGVWLNVHGIINAWIWNDEDRILYNDTEEDVISVEIPEGKTGNIIIIINDEEKINWEINDNYQNWSLEELGIIEVGEYNITVKYLEDEIEEILKETTLNVVEFNNSTFRVIIDSSKRYINFYCPENAEGNIDIFVDVNDEKLEFNFAINETYWDKWNRFYFKDLNISITDSFKIIFEIGDQYSCEKEIDQWADVSFWNGDDERGPLYDDSQGEVISLSFQDSGRTGTLFVLLNDEIKFITKLSLGRDYSWNLKQLNISDDANVELRFNFDDGTTEVFLIN